MQDVNFNWVVALKPEAQILIDVLNLRKSSEQSLFPVYESPDGAHLLVVSGIGKVNAAAATTELCSRRRHESATASGWINFGIAGCSELRYGEPVLAAKVTDSGNERSWYPIASWPSKHDLARLPLVTVEQPVSDYSRTEGLVDMEASGFIPIALKNSSLELVQVLKVVSDDPAHSINEVNKEMVEGLCAGAWERISQWMDAFGEVISAESERILDPTSLREWLDHIHFSVTQQHQLRRLLQEWDAIAGGRVLERPSEANGREALQSLRQQLEEIRTRELSR